MHLLPENIVNLNAAVTNHLHLKERDILLDILRLDAIDPVISGNKWFKLKYYLQAALENNKKQVLTFGGAWSNHIVATACAAKKAGFASIGIIRGEAAEIRSAALQTATACGMQLVFVSRELYNQKKNPAFISGILQQYGHPYIIPEGGEGGPGIRGAGEILNLVKKEDYTHIICAVGTGTQLAGLAGSTAGYQQIIGIPVLKGFDSWQSPYISKETMHRVYILPGYHMGGYAKKNEELLRFMNRFYSETGIPTDWVYTGKLFFAISDLLKKDYFPAGSKLLAIHSGGLQGNDSLEPGTLNF
jgi:1-aminocyclopropane-1-carboxylate deaminase